MLDTARSVTQNVMAGAELARHSVQVATSDELEELFTSAAYNELMMKEQVT